MSDIYILETNLDLKQNLNIYAVCKQLDTLHLNFNVYDDGIQADLTNYNVRLKAMKSDKVPLIQETDYTVSNNLVTIIAHEQLTTTSGTTLVELQFINKTTGEKKATFNLNLKVIASILEVNRTISTATYTLLQELENKLDQASTTKTGLDEINSTALETKTALDLSKSKADASKALLDESNSVANTTKNNLNTSITNANNSKIALDNSKSNADASKIVLDESIDEANDFVATHGDISELNNRVVNVEEEIIKARKTFVDLDVRITEGEGSGGSNSDETTETIKTKLGQVTTTTDGYLSSIDWNTFNNKQNKVFIQTTQPAIALDNLWIDTTSSPYKFYRCDGTTFVQVGSNSNGSGSTSINDWKSSTAYLIKDCVINNLILYRCKTVNSDTVFDSAKWDTIGGSGTTTTINGLSNSVLLEAGTNVSVVKDTTNNKLIINNTMSQYVHPSTSGNKHIPSGGTTGTVLGWASDGTASWITPNNTSSVGKVYATGQGEIFNDYSNNIASGSYSHVEGSYNTATSSSSHVEGIYNKVTSSYSHVEGEHNQDSILSGYSHIEGSENKINVDNTIYVTSAHIEGSQNTITGTGFSSHIEGHGNNLQGGWYCHIEGDSNVVTNNPICAHVGGRGNTANNYSQTIIGQYANIPVSYAANGYSSSADGLIIGNGTSTSSRANAFRVKFNGSVYGLSAFNSTGADYAEWFEWSDGNTQDEDRVGKFVTLDGDKIRLANFNDDYILGIISGNPSVVGDTQDDSWCDMYIRDEFGRLQYEDVEVEEETRTTPAITEIINGVEVVIKPKEKIVVKPSGIEHRIKINPSYDLSKKYVPRSERKEWDCVGMLGKLIVYDDGTCEVNGYCKSGDNGIATKADSGYRVMKRVGDNLIQVLLK